MHLGHGAASSSSDVELLLARGTSVSARWSSGARVRGEVVAGHAHEGGAEPLGERARDRRRSRRRRRPRAGRGTSTSVDRRRTDRPRRPARRRASGSRSRPAITRNWRSDASSTSSGDSASSTATSASRRSGRPRRRPLVADAEQHQRLHPGLVGGEPQREVRTHRVPDEQHVVETEVVEQRDDVAASSRRRRRPRTRWASPRARDHAASSATTR